MTTQLLFYGNIQPLNKEKHKGLYVKTGQEYSFAKEVNSVPLMAVEFAAAASDYAIVFAGNKDQLLPAVITGTTDKENLFVKEDGRWAVDYIPAFVRRYPFVFAASDDQKSLTLCIDESFSGCNTDGKGERLFDSEGESTQYLSTVLSFLEGYQAHFHRTQQFCNKLKELELLEPMTAKFSTGGVEKTLGGFFGVNREKLKNLSGEQAVELLKNDGMELIFLHLQSLTNLNTMVNKKNQEQPIPASTEKEPSKEAVTH